MATLVAAGSARAEQPAAQPPAASPAPEEATLGEIVVTARRRAESLQEVPQTVNAVTADTLQKLNITQFQDVQQVVPGLSLQQSGASFNTAISLRGLTYDANTGASYSVATYLNDAPASEPVLFGALYDVGQIEVLRGPQGTTRGISAPSGAITLTTHKPDLSSMGGYFDGTLTDLQGHNVQGAMNVPLIKDVLAMRIAGLIDDTDGNGVRSIHSAIRPSQTTTSERVSVAFEPSDVFNANLMFEHIDERQTTFDQVSGPGLGTVGEPAISGSQLASVEDSPSNYRANIDVITATIDSRIFGQHLSYVGGYTHYRSGNQAAQDAGDVVPGVEFFQDTNISQLNTTQEIRLASDPAPGRFFDYTVGGFYEWQDGASTIASPGPLTTGAFGNPAQGVNFAAYNPSFQIPIQIVAPGAYQETSLFGSVTFHLGPHTELSGGIRHIWSIFQNNTQITEGTGKLALPASLFGGSCAGAHLASTYPGYCDFVLPGGASAGSYNSRSSNSPNIYNVSLSHHLTRDLLLYANTGTSFRPPVASIGLQGAIVNSPDPSLNTLSFHPAERSRAYEVGFKATFLDGRARLNAALFRQRLNNLTIYTPNINYLNTATNAVANFGFTASVDALVQGVDVDSAFQITPDWTIGAQMSYSDGKVQGSQAPCNIGPASAPVFNTVDPATGKALISLCPGGSVSRLPYWNASLQSEYTRPVAGDMDGFFRLLATYYPQNKNRAEPDFTVDNYSLVNLYLGARSHDGAWEASIFARNVLGADRTLDRSPIPYNANTELSTFFPTVSPTSGYYATRVTPRREVGVNLRYAWGSR